MKIEGKTAVITGAASGIGRALAIAFAAENCNLALVDVNEEGLKETREKIGGAKVSLHVADLGDSEVIDGLMREILAAHAEIDILCNIAGITAVGSFRRLSKEQYDRVMSVNFFGTANLTRSFLPHLQQRPEAHIVNMSSIFGLVSIPGQSAYAASKHAIRAFSNALALELGHKNVHVTVAYPGAVSTNIAIAAKVDRQTDRLKKGLTPEKTAQSILRAVKKNKRDIVIGKDAKLLVFLSRLFPKSYWKIVKKL